MSLLPRLRRLLSLLGVLLLRLPLLRLRLLPGLGLLLWLRLLPFGLLFFSPFLTVNLDSRSGKPNQANQGHKS